MGINKENAGLLPDDFSKCLQSIDHQTLFFRNRVMHSVS